MATSVTVPTQATPFGASLVERSDESQTAPASSPAGPRSILLIGDDPLMMRALSRLLQKAGYTVGIGERSGEDAGSREREGAGPEIALTIVDVPDDWSRLGALEPFPQPWDERRRVLWITSAPNVVARSDRCLIKPFTAQQLLARVEALLGQESQ